MLDHVFWLKGSQADARKMYAQPEDLGEMHVILDIIVNVKRGLNIKHLRRSHIMICLFYLVDLAHR